MDVVAPELMLQHGLVHMLASVRSSLMVGGYTMHGYLFCPSSELDGRVQHLIKTMHAAIKERALPIREPGELTKLDDEAAKIVREIVARRVPMSALKMVSAGSRYFSVWLIKNGLEDNERLLKFH